MSASSDTPNVSEDKVAVDGAELMVLRGGSGKPLLVLHEELGYSGWLNWHTTLAKTRTLVIPQHPGFGRSPQVDWIKNIRDLAGLYSLFVRQQRLAPVDVVGFSIGGWIAAEMAACNPEQFRKMVLVAPAGIRPPSGEILDFFQMMAPDHLRAGVLDPEKAPEYNALYGGQGPAQFELWEEARAATARLAWQPFMHNPALPHLLRNADALPTMLVWGKQDGVVPPSAAEVFRRAIPKAKMVLLDDCGHRPEIERAADFIREVQAFIA